MWNWENKIRAVIYYHLEKYIHTRIHLSFFEIATYSLLTPHTLTTTMSLSVMVAATTFQKRIFLKQLSKHFLYFLFSCFRNLFLVYKTILETKNRERKQTDP